MPGTIASAVDLPGLGEAARARGLRLVPVEAEAADAVLLAWSAGQGALAARVAAARAGWAGPLMLVLVGGGGSVAEALDAGADEAVQLPASVCEIAARLSARLRARAEPILVGALRIDPLERRVLREERRILLLPREYALLLHLARNAGRTVGRAELLRAVWGLGFDPGTNVVEVHVSRLRAKLDRGYAEPMLHTDKGRGYRLG